jgi:hypothetical protein
MSTEQRLLTLKSKIRKEEKAIQESEARLKVLMDQLKKDFGTDDLKYATKLFEDFLNEEHATQKKIDKLLKEVEENYDF